ncbi:hypothetical protein ACGFRG_21175 [Streptomyces sp. NPDC048696]|uniref:hypothetical protein n=1 Tax=Streptomyces sp. NPDC048696 TaxID=3365585 RepID=UPI00371DFF30
MARTPTAPSDPRHDGASARDDLAAALSGAALAVSAVGAALAYIPLDSPLRAPLALFFLIAAPAEALAFALRRLEPLTRAVASFSGAVLINLVIAETMAIIEVRSVRSEIIMVAVISFLLFLAGTGVNRSATDRSRMVKNPKT